MKQDDKDLLLRDLCARLPYGVRIKRETITGSYAKIEFTLSLETFNYLKIGIQEDRYSIKPYLRPMSSMTEEEKKDFVKFHCVGLCPIIVDDCLTIKNESDMIDWLIERHFDFRGLIEKGLALEAPEGMYKIE